MSITRDSNKTRRRSLVVLKYSANLLWILVAMGTAWSLWGQHHQTMTLFDTTPSTTTLSQQKYDLYLQEQNRQQVRARQRAQLTTASASTITTSTWQTSADTSSASAPDATTTTTAMRFDYSQPAVRTLSTLRDPAPCQNSSTTVATLVMSARTNWDRRAAIRETWGAHHCVYFIIGGPPPSKNPTSSLQSRTPPEQRHLLKEQAQHRDLLDSIHPESYQSLPYKLKFAYQWILSHQNHIQWIVKVDDDTLVRVESLHTALLQPLNPQLPIVVGKIVEHSAVAMTGKWAEHKYPKSYYPYWPKGSCGHVVSRPIASYVASTPNLTYYQGEDTSLGIWLDESPLSTVWISSPYFRNDRQCRDHEWLIMGHDTTVSEMRDCFKQYGDEWDSSAMFWKRQRFWSVETLHQSDNRARGGMWSEDEGSHYDYDEPDFDTAYTTR